MILLAFILLNSFLFLKVMTFSSLGVSLMVQNYNVEHVKLHFSWACFKKPATLKKMTSPATCQDLQYLNFRTVFQSSYFFNKYLL